MEGFQMKLEQHVLDEAMQIINDGKSEFPVILQEGRFWLALADDESIIAASSFSVGETKYKIGFYRES